MSAAPSSKVAAEAPFFKSTSSTSSSKAAVEETFSELVNVFRDFLNSQNVWNEGRNYREKIASIVSLDKRRLIVNLNDVRSFSPQLAKDLIQRPLEHLPPFEKALTDIVLADAPNPAAIETAKAPFRIGFEGAFGDVHVSPRQLSADLLSHMICIDGIVTSCSLVRPKLVKSVHFCEKKQIFYAQDYRDAITSYNEVPTSNAYPTEDFEGNALASEYGLSIYRDHQIVTLQEMPEKAPPGQLPRGIDIVLADDLVDAVKPGDRVQAVGVYRALAPAAGQQIPAYFKVVVVGNNVRKLFKDIDEERGIEAADMEVIRRLSKRRDIFPLLARSLAPSIHGHEHIKKALLLLLLGGVEKNLENGTHIRGDINILLIGDPSTAKSQLLRFIMCVAPLAISTTGRGASGVGLTAAVTFDKETGDRRLEAGAMVLADRGVICVDEFDKMSDEDRVAIHEVMEQQTVTISKAGIHASLNARCSMIAAANPILGQYKESLSPQENIRLPDSLLSRFDLTFIVLDTIDPVRDRQISSHVLKMHRYLPPGVDIGTPLTEEHVARERENLESLDNANDVFIRYANNRHQSTDVNDSDASSNDELDDGEDYSDAHNLIVALPFVKKYLNVAKSTFKPVLTKVACDYISDAYAEFRQTKSSNAATAGSKTSKTFPVTARTLETLIRLASAHAKLRFSNRVEKKDAIVAKQLIEFCLYKEVKSKRVAKKKPKINIEEDKEDDNSSGSEAESHIQDFNEESKRSASTTSKMSVDSIVKDTVRSSTYESTQQSFVSMDAFDSSSVPSSSVVSVTPAKIQMVRAALNLLRDSDSVAEMFEFDALMKNLKDAAISTGEVVQVLREMEDANQLMFRDDYIIFI